MNRLNIIQKKIIRIITNSDWFAHSAPLFDKLNIMNIYKLFEYCTGIFIFKAFNGDMPDSIRAWFNRNLTKRNSVNLRTIYRKKKFTQMCVKAAGPKIWNNFSVKCKTSQSIYSFKKHLKRHLTSIMSEC